MSTLILIAILVIYGAFIIATALRSQENRALIALIKERLPKRGNELTDDWSFKMLEQMARDSKTETHEMLRGVMLKMMSDMQNEAKNIEG